MGCFWSVFSCGLLKPVRHVSSSSLTETNRQTAKKEEGNNSSINDRSITKVAIRSEDDILQASNLKKFQYSELKGATRNFRPDNLLGEGGFGSVFKGWIDENTLMPSKPGSGIVVAVKKLNLDGLQGHEEWLAEVNYLGQLHHPNLVRLIGYSLENEHRLLVYEFMPRGNLENHLFRRGSSFQPLSWDLRIKIALGSAKGVEFLHDAKPQVIYRDLKTSNILIDSDYNAKLSDFGLAKNGPTDDDTHVTTRVMGTHGYAAPEYLTTGHLTSKSDVYSFGVVLLELFTGKRVIDSNRPTYQLNLVDWALPFLKSKRKVLSILDPRLEAYSPQGAMTTAHLTQRCLNIEGKLRPNMNEIVEALEKIQDLKLSSKFSRPLRRNSFPKQH